MLKKLLTLSLVAVMLSTVALASNGVVGFGVATYAEEAEELDKTVTASATDNPIEFLWVSQNAETGAQTISTKTWPSSAANPTIGANNWILAKINVGENMNFTSMSFTVPIQFKGAKGSNNFYLRVAPLAYTDYVAAEEAKAAGTTLTSLVKPVEGGENVASVKKSHATSTNTTQGTTITLDSSLFNNTAAYHGGYVYLAFTAADGDATDRYLSLKSDKVSTWKLVVKYTVVEAPAYTDFSEAVIAWDNGTCTISNVPATGTAMLIAASFSGTTMVDAQVATIDAANAENGVITETFTGLADGTVKLFLWDSTTLAPAIGVTNAN